MSDVTTEIARFEVSAQWMHACGEGPEAKTFNVLKIDFHLYAGPRFRRMITVADTFGSWVVAEFRGSFVAAEVDGNAKASEATEVSFGPSGRVWRLTLQRLDPWRQQGLRHARAARAEALRICHEESYRAIAERHCVSLVYRPGY
jgi:hypothetical protein